MDVDHGFSQALKRLLGGVNTYPVLPIFVSCLQPPFSPFARARALGEAVGSFARTLGQKRILFMGTGGLAHNPYHLFPPIDERSEEHTSELQSLMRISYAVFCLKKKKKPP